MSHHLTIRKAIVTPREVAWIANLQDQHSSRVGFFPKSVLIEKVDLGRVMICEVDGTRAGYLLHGATRNRDVRIFQTCVSRDFRRRGVATALVKQLYQMAASAKRCGCSTERLSLRVRPEMADAITFYMSVGFSHASDEDGLHVYTCPVDATKRVRPHTYKTATEGTK